MPGPLPKDPKTRQRSNKAISRALLSPEKRPIKHTPRLPDLEIAEWSDLTRAWWEELWQSPQSDLFLRSDLGSLFRLAVLQNKFFTTFSLAVASELRLLEREFGLTSLSRRRLEWTVAQTESAIDKREHGRAKRAQIIDGDDPRSVLEG